MPTPLWIPSPERAQATAMTDFRRAAEQHTGQALPDFAALHRWSIQDPAAFWAFYADYAALPFSAPAACVMSDEPMPYTSWFEGVTLNYAEALLYPPGLQDEQQTAIIALKENGEERRLSYADLRREVARCASALRRSGITAGDRVAAYACNTPETIVLLLACASIGAIFSSCSPDFGFEAARARFGQIRPKLLFAFDSYDYGGKRFDTLPTVKRLVAEIKGLQATVLIPYEGKSAETDFVTWQDWLEAASIDLNLEPGFAALPFDHPLYILYSSGTTGLPKAMVHRAGGVLITHHKEHLLHSDIRPGEVVFYFSTCGWMMWNWLVSALAQAATIVLYEGSPAHPDMATLWRLAERLGITFFGTSARFIKSCQAAQVKPKSFADLGALKTVASTGSPLSAAGFRWAYKQIKEDIHLASISGGTDIVSCFMLGDPARPVYAGQIQGPGLGVDMVAFDEGGQPVLGEPGELVCRQPLPSMPLEFWHDPNMKRYKAAYFEHYPDVWRHGDLIEVTEQGGIIVYGRSDATLNPGGVRIGTAEIYKPLETLPEVVEALAVGKREAGDEAIWLFVVLQAAVQLDEGLEQRIKAQIRQEASPRHVPKKIFQIRQLPRTRSGKATEIAVSRLINEQDVPNREVLANPEALDEIKQTVDNA